MVGATDAALLLARKHEELLSEPKLYTDQSSVLPPGTQPSSGVASKKSKKRKAKRQHHGDDDDDEYNPDDEDDDDDYIDNGGDAGANGGAGELSPEEQLEVRIACHAVTLSLSPHCARCVRVHLQRLLNESRAALRRTHVPDNHPKHTWDSLFACVFLLSCTPPPQTSDSVFASSCDVFYNCSTVRLPPSGVVEVVPPQTTATAPSVGLPTGALGQPAFTALQASHQPLPVITPRDIMIAVADPRIKKVSARVQQQLKASLLKG